MSFFGEEPPHDPGGSKPLAMLPGVQGDAVFGGPADCYRYLLTRWWGGSRDGPAALFIGMNPSTATADNDDPTIRRELAITNRLGLRVYIKANVSPYRATFPDMLTKVRHKLFDADNVVKILSVAKAPQTRKVILACGVLPEVLVPIGRNLLQQLDQVNVKLFCLGISKDGYPRHPLYLKADTPLITWTGRF